MAKRTTTAPTPEPTPATEPVATPVPPLGIQAQRAALRAAGLKRCPTHARYLDRLPEAAQQPVDGNGDPTIRPLSEFGHEAACRACAHLRAADHRAERRQLGGGDTRTTAIRRLASLLRQQARLTERMTALQATLTEDEQAVAATLLDPQRETD